MGWLRVGIAALLLVLLGGCGQPRSRVHGTVRYQGKPLSEGTIIFLASDNRAYPVLIGSDGSYQIASVPRGRVHVAVLGPRITEVDASPRSLRRRKKNAEAAKTDDDAKVRRETLSAAPAVKVPPRYADPEQSGLDFDLQSSEQEYSLDLK